jgi:exonuclease III
MPVPTGLDWLQNELRPLLEDGARGGDVVIAGDLNTSSQWSSPSAHKKVQSEFVSHGFRNALAGAVRYGAEHGPCPCKNGNCEHAPTFRQTLRGKTTWWSIDYIWLSRSLHDRVVDVGIDYTRCPEYSDHACAYVDLDV